MQNNHKTNPKFTSPRGIFRYPKLTEPDYGSKEFPKPDGEYSVNLVLEESDEATQAFLNKLRPLHEEAIAEGQQRYNELKAETRKKLDKQGGLKTNGYYTELLDKDTEETTGEISFKISMKASGEFKKGPKTGERWNRKPGLFDAKGKPLGKIPDIWGGTEGKVSFEASPYFIPGTGTAGLKLSLNAVQVLELISGGQRSAKDYGFGEEDGYSYEEPEAEAEDKGADGIASDDEGSSDF